MDAQQDVPEPPPEAVLIRRARQARGLTRAEAAERSSVVKASRWGQIENGYLMKAGVPVSTKAGDMQLAHMARTVGLSPERLEESGRTDAAEILREIQEQEQSYADMSDRLERTAWEMPLSVEDRKLIVDMLREAKSQGRSGRSA
ncbi:helix-turn-helix transcriptional regulator [Streptomyces stelliscabiei]|uniref:helix-turn-helix transcriptional regulator n=1 Tax=Streptomyces stelliscabiei TaxID=146820 RepID=UPI0029ADB302|nr:helix-turn-helix transcriptional regulator [Streptomyces stelliscabiei]MDX2667432.1 helix-turn-helix transcriptional regulator [Streptomyces stelliscabiei]MDX2785971.1 helix-turn-helix transcriptional regulator [Streptomyces stelliscabiei]